MNKNVHIVMSSDENYVPHAAVSMLSLCENNREIDHVTFHLLSSGISDDSLLKLRGMLMSFAASLAVYETGDMNDLAKITLIGNISLSAYSRLFMTSILPENINRVIYMDVDSVVTGSIVELWNMDLGNCLVAGVLDNCERLAKRLVKLKDNDFYVNSGMLVIPLDRWRKEGVEKLFLEFLHENNGKVYHHDQGVINGVLRDRIKILLPKYNVMTCFYEMSVREIVGLSGTSPYYTQEEIENSIQYPVFVHFTPSLSGRPWFARCRHPKLNIYVDTRKRTPWSLWDESLDQRAFHVKVMTYTFFLLGYYPLKGVIKFIALLKRWKSYVK